MENNGHNAIPPTHHSPSETGQERSIGGPPPEYTADGRELLLSIQVTIEDARHAGDEEWVETWRLLGVVVRRLALQRAARARSMG